MDAMPARRLERGWRQMFVRMMIPNRPGRSADYRFFNCNYYPEHVESLLEAAEERYAHVLLWVTSLPSQLSRDVDDFLKTINAHLACGPRNWPPNQEYLAVYQGAAASAVLHGFLLSLKSLLDVLGSAWALTVAADCSMRGFRKGRVDGEELAGGAFVNWFRNSSPAAFKHGRDVAELVACHSREWITEAVHRRDTIVHRGELQELTPMAVVLDNGNVVTDDKGTCPRQVYERDEVLLPSFDSGCTVDDYCRRTASRLRDFILSMDRFFSSEDRRPPGAPGPGDRFWIAEGLLASGGADEPN